MGGGFSTKWLSASLALAEAVLTAKGGERHFQNLLWLFKSKTPLGLCLFCVDVYHDFFPSILHVSITQDSRRLLAWAVLQGERWTRCLLWATAATEARSWADRGPGWEEKVAAPAADVAPGQGTCW